jgi:hypothetical protein
MEDLEACLGVEGNLAKKLTQWKKKIKPNEKRRRGEELIEVDRRFYGC